MNKKYIKILGVLALGILAFSVISAYTFKSLSAQNVLNGQAESVMDSYKMPPIEELAYSKDKDGCVMKFSMFSILLGEYMAGKDINKMNEIKIMRDLFATEYDNLRKKGVEKASVDMMKEHRDCMKNAPVRNEKKVEQYEACTTLHNNVIDVLRSIKNRKKSSMVAARYKNKKMDLSKTAYKGVDNAMPTIVENLYKASSKHGYDKAVIGALMLSARCLS